MAGAVVEIIGESTVGDVVARDLARARASLDELEKSGVGGATVAAGGGPFGFLGGLLNGLPNAVDQIAGAIRTALDQIAALPPTQIKLSDSDAQNAIHNVFASATALAATNFEPVKVTADISDVYLKARLVEQRLAQIQDKEVTVTVNIVTNGSVPSVASGGSGASAEAHAAGTLAAGGGLSLVGERGPELVNLPRGAQVFDALDTRQALGQARGGDTYISALYITAPNNATLTDLLRQAQSARGA